MNVWSPVRAWLPRRIGDRLVWLVQIERSQRLVARRWVWVYRRRP